MNVDNMINIVVEQTKYKTLINSIVDHYIKINKSKSNERCSNINVIDTTDNTDNTDHFKIVAYILTPRANNNITVYNV